ncbi:MAG: XTP/dITP diphosphatase [Thermoplasmata archaeon YP2-bin.285]|uniref:XTP/dITP diphosphatase n=1 Tax=Candidatus Sysuiplasma superficiale TaxID=2823368 RepID=A0A8J7YRE1_9ARCH|nr:XTP/dITP diphosphatase [Candidatus Sysuiplasma superficiale]
MKLAELTLITTNEGKYLEIIDALEGTGVSIRRIDREYPEIQADTLESVVGFGLNYLKPFVPGPFIIDDSGLFVDALGGFPGVYSSYAFRTIGNEGILTLLKGKGNRRASFRTVLGMVHEGKEHFFRGECRGYISELPKGVNGFGFDPIFVPEGREMTFAEMSVQMKNDISHRGMALRRLKNFLVNHGTLS